jgi:hypothetical protein
VAPAPIHRRDETRAQSLWKPQLCHVNSRWLAAAVGARLVFIHTMRDLEVLDSEPRLIAAVRRSIREHGGEPSSRHVDELLDERLARAEVWAGIEAAIDR